MNPPGKRREAGPFWRSERGFTAAEKALLVCFGLGAVTLVGYLVSQGSGKAAGDAARVLREQSGGVRLGQVVQPMQAASAGASAGQAPQALAFKAAGPPGAQAGPEEPHPPLAVPITADDLLQIAPRMSREKAELYAPAINEAMQRYDINTKEREAAFLAQIAQETDGFNTLMEYADGSEYEGRTDLGNTHPGDGVRYKGRGAIQLTGRYNYEKAGTAFGLDLINDPDQAADPAVAFKIAGWYWDKNSLNDFADSGELGDFKTITRRINGGLNGEADREIYWERAKRALDR